MIDKFLRQKKSLISDKAELKDTRGKKISSGSPSWVAMAEYLSTNISYKTAVKRSRTDQPPYTSQEPTKDPDLQCARRDRLAMEVK